MGGNWMTADNRRLWVFKHLERLGKCSEIPVRITRYIAPGKINTQSNGMHINIRNGGNPGGYWHLKPSVSLNVDGAVIDDKEATGSLSSVNTEETDFIDETAEPGNTDRDLSSVEHVQVEKYLKSYLHPT